MNELVKNCKYIINANQDFFKGLSNIERVVVYGFIHFMKLIGLI